MHSKRKAAVKTAIAVQIVLGVVWLLMLAAVALAALGIVEMVDKVLSVAISTTCIVLGLIIIVILIFALIIKRKQANMVAMQPSGLPSQFIEIDKDISTAHAEEVHRRNGQDKSSTDEDVSRKTDQVLNVAAIEPQNTEDPLQIGRNNSSCL